MAAPVVHLTFADGTEEQVVLNPRVLVEVERHFDGTIPPIEGSMYGAWWRLGQPGKEAGVSADKAFDSWMDSVESIDEKGGDVRPTRPAPTAGT